MEFGEVSDAFIGLEGGVNFGDDIIGFVSIFVAFVEGIEHEFDAIDVGAYGDEAFSAFWNDLNVLELFVFDFGTELRFTAIEFFGFSFHFVHDGFEFVDDFLIGSERFVVLTEFAFEVGHETFCFEGVRCIRV